MPPLTAPRVLCLSLLVALGGCASRHVAPTDGPRADVTLRATPMPGGTFVSSFATRECGDRRSLALLSPDNREQASTQVRAGQELVLTFKHSAVTGYNSQRMCQATVAFVPRDGAHYEVRYDVETAAMRCRAAVVVERAGGRWEPMPEASTGVKPCNWY